MTSKCDKNKKSGNEAIAQCATDVELMNGRISTEYVSIKSRRDHELLIVIFKKIYKFPYSFLYYLDAIMDVMHKRGRHLVQYFCQ